jgi:ABC-type Zn uptake system ZnuABC Zn-binding protein ZnuA
MTHNVINLPTSVSREFGKAGLIEVNLAEMPLNALEYIFAYGLKQVLTDAHSTAKTPDEAKAMTGKKLDALMRGEVRMQSSRTSDPVLAEAKRLAKVKIDAALKAKGIKAEAKAITEAVAKLAPQYMEEAKRNVDAAQAASGGIDLSALGL